MYLNLNRNTTIMSPMTISLPKDTEKELREIAKKERRTISGQIAFLVDFYKGNKEK
jgi:hypothetical protein